MTSRPRATLGAIARSAGVSRSTAARTLGGYGNVAPALQAQVVAAAAQLGYRPNGLARSVSSGRSQTIGVVVSDVEDGHFTRAVRGISDVAQEHGYAVILVNTDERIDLERAAVATLLDNRVDGIVVASSRGNVTEHLVEALDMDRGVVLLDRDLPGLDCDWVGTDDYRWAREVCELLAEQGHRAVWFVVATTHSPDDVDVRGREPISTTAHRIRAMRDVGRERHMDVRVLTGAMSRERTRLALQQALRDSAPPTAIVASYSEIMLSVLEELRSRGLSVPGQISVVSLDDARWMEVTEPRITAIRRPSYEMGRRAAEILLRRLGEEQRSAPTRESLASELVVRGSITRSSRTPSRGAVQPAT